jgi:hypothetical protein
VYLKTELIRLCHFVLISCSVLGGWVFSKRAINSDKLSVKNRATRIQHNSSDEETVRGYMSLKHVLAAISNVCTCCAFVPAPCPCSVSLLQGPSIIPIVWTQQELIAATCPWDMFSLQFPCNVCTSGGVRALPARHYGWNQNFAHLHGGIGRVNISLLWQSADINEPWG